MRKRISWRRIAIGAGVAAAAFIAWRTYTWLRPPPKLVVSRDTTWFTEPLDADGNVDYAEIWRRRHAPGVTAANNAAPLVYAALGWDRTQFTPEERAALPEVATPFVEFHDWEIQHRDAFAPPATPDGDAGRAALLALNSGDIESRQDPAISRWFEAVEPSLRIVRDATSRDRFYAEDARPLSSWNVNLWALNEVAHALAWSALRHASRGEADAACSELSVVLRLARLERSIEGALQCTIAAASEELVWTVAVDAATKHEGFSPHDVSMLANARDPTPAEKTAASLIEWSRVFELAAFEKGGMFAGLMRSNVLFSRLDPNRMLRRINAWADRIVATWTGTDDWGLRLSRLEEFHSEALAHKKLDESGLGLRFLLTGPDALTDAVGESWAAGGVLRSVSHLQILAGGIATADITLAELAAGAFARETGHDPATSDDLTPRIFETPFRDRLTHSAVTFARDASGRLVASGPVVDLKRQLEPPKR